ncbi:amino acid adenylation domain-containing protein [Polymorphospora sp. NPDC051019]|uniref:amino acid adenylation domain-containing protein n=1 Tax=Polymorphospora sp. NPDC051019 TaxID=3155725 RepID=UPI003441DA51
MNDFVHISNNHEDVHWDTIFDFVLPELFERQVATRPHAPAITYNNQTLTYTQLNTRANAIAETLHEHGIQPEEPIGVCLPRGIELITTLLAITKTGAAYLPLDPTHPPARINQLTQHANVKTIITTRHNTTPLPPHTTTIHTEDLPTTPTKPPQPCPATPQNLAYILYTSGSTGQPKAVAVPHRAITRLVTHQTHITMGPHQNYLLHSPTTFDASTFEIWAPLLNGGQLTIAPPGQLTTPELHHLITTHHINTLWLTAGLFHLIIDDDPTILTPIQQLLTGGEPVSPTHAEKARQHLPNTQIIDGYGPTETTTFATCHPLPPHQPITGPIPIGTPLNGTETHILDHHWQPTPPGTTGELFIGGPALARGYHNQPHLTAEKFIPHPTKPGQRLYHTGDLVRQTPDGTIHYIGRTDHQIKIRGHRIEPAETQTTLQTHPDITTTHITTHHHPHRGPQLTAYVIPRDLKRIPGANELRDFLRQTLPDYLVPTQYVVLDALPLTPNGKVDRDALPAPDALRTRRPYAPPATETQDGIARIYAEILQLERVGVNENFSELGGHSLFAMQVASRVRKVFGVALTPAQVFGNPSVSALADQVEQERAKQSVPAMPVLTTRSRRPHEPLSWQQEQVWFLASLAQEHGAYRAQASVRIHGTLDADLLDRALTAVAVRHEIVRTVFAETDGQPYQIVQDPGPVRATRYDLTDIPPQDRPARAHEVIAHELKRPFVLSRLPLMHWTLIRHDEQEYELVLVEHHLVHDGWSFTILMRDLESAYLAFRLGKPTPLPASAIQYADYCRWQRETIDAPAMRAQLDFWRTRLADPPAPATLPPDRPRANTQSFRGDLLRAELPAALASKVRKFARDNGATLFMTLLAGFVTLLHRHTGERDICLGSGFANRRLRETEDLVGMFVNTVVLRVGVAGDPSFQELLQRVRDVALEASANQEYPFVRLVQLLNPSRDRTGNPYIRTLFSFNDSPLTEINLAGTPGTVFERHNGSAKMDLNVIVVPRAERQLGETGHVDNRITLLWEYNADIFDKTTMRQAVRSYLRLLESAVAAAATPVSRLDWLDDEQRLLLASWSSRSPVPDDAFDFVLPELFERQVATRPHAPAITYNNQTLTYTQLNTRANAIAETLHEHGIQPEEPIGVCLPRGIELITTLLAITKTGAAYLPLDPTHPPARINQLTQHANVKTIITTRHNTTPLPPHTTTIHTEDLPTTPTKPPQPCPATPQNLAYILYTSGSTGQPKAVAVPHRAITRLVTHQTHITMGPHQNYLLHSPTTFDASTFEIWAPLLNGGQLTIAPPGQLTTPELHHLITTHHINTLWLTAGLFHLIIDDDPTILTPIQQLLTGGEPVSPTHAEKARQHHPNTQIIDGYGPTETTTLATCHPLPPHQPITGPIPIGTPLNGTETHILDHHWQPTPPGTTGELFIGGPALARGYHNQPHLTAEKFIPHPTKPGQRLYHTGDLVRQTPDGTIHYIGRTDHQIKIRGHRIEPAETQTTLQTHPDITTTHITTHHHPHRGPQLTAYVTSPEPDRAGLVAELRQYVAQLLPEHLRPTDYVVLDELPLTPNGKVDKARLPDPAPPVTPEAAVPPTTSMEHLVSEVWADVLGFPDFGVTDNFFDIGGHSLLIGRVRSRLSARLERSVPIVALYEHPTVHAIARYLSSGDTSRGADHDSHQERDSQRDRAVRRQQHLAELRGRRITG